jgi:predicted ArsR family transcriptional regulator
MSRIDSPVARLLSALSNPISQALLIALEDGPSYPRALASRLDVSEGEAQRRLRDLARVGLVGSAWHYDGRTTKRYALCAAGVRFEFGEGRIVSQVLDIPVSAEAHGPRA